MIRAALLLSALCVGCFDPLVGPACADGYTACEGKCVDLAADSEHCGACGSVCETGDCAAGLCLADIGPDAAVAADATPRNTTPDAQPLECQSGEIACSGICAAPQANPDHCGACGIACSSGVCIAGSCQDTVPGHLVVIGHDYRSSRSGMNLLLGNAVLLTTAEPVRVLTYAAEADPDAVRGADAAISEVLTARGRSWTKTAMPSTGISQALPSHDVLLIYAQAQAPSDAMLDQLGASWESALNAFLASGGIVITLEGPAGHSGTHRIVTAAGLIQIGGRIGLSQPLVNITAPSDAIATGVPSVYLGEQSTSRFITSEPGVVAEADGAIVLHRTF